MISECCFEFKVSFIDDTKHAGTQYADTQHVDTHHNDAQHINTQQNDTQDYSLVTTCCLNDIQHNDTQKKHVVFSECPIMVC